MAAKKAKGKAKRPGVADPDRLSAREQGFVDAYTDPGKAKGVAWLACKLAGYAGNQATLAVQGSRLLKKAKVLKAIELATVEVRAKTVADRRERQEFFTKVFRGEVDEEVVVVVAEGDFCSRAEKVRKQVGGRDRLKAAELLGKVQGDFIDRLESRAADAFRGRFQALQRAMGKSAWTFDQVLTFFAEGE